MLSYEGIFFEGKTADFIHSLEKQRLPIVNDVIHCTFKCYPSNNEIFNELVGKEFDVLIIGYGCDGNNSGFELRLPDSLVKYYINYDEQEPSKLKKPHITASLTREAKPFKTKDLEFKPLDTTYSIRGRFGYWIKENNNEYVSYEKYNNK